MPVPIVQYVDKRFQVAPTFEPTPRTDQATMDPTMGPRVTAAIQIFFRHILGQIRRNRGTPTIHGFDVNHPSAVDMRPRRGEAELRNILSNIEHVEMYPSGFCMLQAFDISLDSSRLSEISKKPSPTGLDSFTAIRETCEGKETEIPTSPFFNTADDSMEAPLPFSIFMVQETPFPSLEPWSFTVVDHANK